MVISVCVMLSVGVMHKKAGYKKKICYFEQLIQSASYRHNVDPQLVKAVVKQESKFQQNAVGSKGEVGLMQLTPMAVQDWERVHHRRLGSRSVLFAPRLNIEIGTWYLGIALNHWHHHRENVVMALIQYNAGRSRAVDWARDHQGKPIMEIIPFETTRTYIKHVLTNHAEFLKSPDTYRDILHGSTK